MPITGLYAAIFTIFYILLCFNVIRYRAKFKVGIKSNGHLPLDLAIRVQGNFSEYIPLSLILMALIEAQRGNINWLHLMGQALLFGRILHFWGLGVKGAGASPQRFIGTAITYTALLGASGWLIYLSSV